MTRLVYDQLGKPIPVLSFRDGNTQTVSVSGTSARVTTAFLDKTRVVRIVCTEPSHYQVGPSAGNPAADTGDTYLPAETIEYVGVNGGDKIAFIEAGTGGTAFVTEAD